MMVFFLGAVGEQCVLKTLLLHMLLLFAVLLDF